MCNYGTRRRVWETARGEMGLIAAGPDFEVSEGHSGTRNKKLEGWIGLDD